MAGTWSTPYASARSRSMARLSTSTVIWSESSATSRTSCSFCWQSSAAASSCEKTTSFTGAAMRSNSLRTAAWSRGFRIGMASLYLLDSVMPRLEALAVYRGERACTNDDLIRNAAYCWSPMTAKEIEQKTGIVERLYTELDLDHISLLAAQRALEKS